MPGAPPNNTREPTTAPPPRTLSSSFIPVEKRISSCVSSCEIGDALLFLFLGDFEPEDFEEDGLTASGSSTIVFHAPHAVH